MFTKKLLFILSLSLTFSPWAWNESFEGLLEVKSEKGLDLVHTNLFGNEKDRNLPAGEYEGAQVTLLSSHKLRIHVEGQRKIKIKLSEETSIPRNGHFSVKSEDSGQKYDLQGGVSTEEEISETHVEDEDCTYLDTDRHCFRRCLIDRGHHDHRRRWDRWDYWNRPWLSIVDHHHGEGDHKKCKHHDDHHDGDGKCKCKHKSHGKHGKYSKHDHQHGDYPRERHRHCKYACQTMRWGQRSVTYRHHDVKREFTLKFILSGRTVATYIGNHWDTKKIYEESGVCR